MDVKYKLCGLFGSALYLIMFIGLALSPFTDRSNNMTLNELGDLLAGMVGPIGVIWLIMGFMQQSADLRLQQEALKKQSEALDLQIEELKESRKQAQRIEDLNRRSLEDSQRIERQSSRAFITCPGAGRISDILEIQLVNSGAVATNVRVSYEDLPFEPEDKEWSLWPANSKMKIRLPRAKDIPEKFGIWFKYRDSKGHNDAELIRLKKAYNGNYLEYEHAYIDETTLPEGWGYVDGELT